jgi:hypothetical protein
MRATPHSWDRQPFTDGRAIPFQQRFTAAEFERLQDGLIPRAMEDKWFVYFEAPYLYFHRSWTGQPVYRVKLVPEGEGATVAEAELAPGTTFEDAYAASLLDFLIANLLLGKAKPFPLPESHSEPAKGVFQHHIAGTGYPQGKPKPTNT